MRFFVFILNKILEINSSFSTLLPSLLDHNIDYSHFIILAIFSILMSAKAKTFVFVGSKVFQQK